MSAALDAARRLREAHGTRADASGWPEAEFRRVNDADKALRAALPVLLDLAESAAVRPPTATAKSVRAIRLWVIERGGPDHVDMADDLDDVADLLDRVESALARLAEGKP